MLGKHVRKIFKFVMPVAKRIKSAHVFCGRDMMFSSNSIAIMWPCARCGQAFEFGYGLQASSVGIITGPYHIPYLGKELRDMDQCLFPPPPIYSAKMMGDVDALG